MKTLLLLLFVLFVVGCDARPAPWIRIPHVAFSPDGKWLVAAGGRLGKLGRPWGGDGVVKVWQTSNWKLHATWKDGFTNPVDQLFFVSKEIVATASDKLIRDTPGSPDDGVLVRYWEIATKKELPPLHLHLKDTRHAFGIGYYAPDKLVAYNSGDLRKVGIFTLPNLEKKCTLEGHPKGSWLLQFSPDGKRILSLSYEKPFVRLHDVATGKRIAEHNLDYDLDTANPNEINIHGVQARFSSDGKMIAVAENSKVYVLTSDLSAVLFDVKGEHPRGRAEFSPDSEMIAVRNKDSKVVELYSLKTKEVVKSFSNNPEGAYAWCFSPDGNWIAITSAGDPGGSGRFPPSKVRVFEVKTGKLVAELD